MNQIVDFALAKGKTTLTVALLIILAGAFARSTIPVASDPSIQIPIVSVSVFLDGASPDDASRLVVRPLENRLRSVPITGTCVVARSRLNRSMVRGDLHGAWARSAGQS